MKKKQKRKYVKKASLAKDSFNQVKKELDIMLDDELDRVIGQLISSKFSTTETTKLLFKFKGVKALKEQIRALSFK